MSASSISKRFAPAVMAVAMSLTFLASACTDMPVASRDGYAATQGNGNACDAARLAAWFERQRQLTDGDVNPAVQAKAPAECMRTSAASGDQSSQPKQG